MIKYFAIVFILVLFIGCKSPVTEMPTYVVPDAEDSTGQETQPPSPAPAPEEVPFVPPSGYIGSGGDSDVSIDVIDGDLHVAYSNSKDTISFGKYTENEWDLTDTGLAVSDLDAPLDITYIGNTPYMAFADGNGNGKLRFMTYNGSEWVNVLSGNHVSDFSAPAISAVGLGTKIYIAFNEYNDDMPGDRAIGVLEYDSESNALVGLVAPYNSPSSNTHLSNVNGNLLIVYLDSSTARTYMYDNDTNEWTAIGVAGTATGQIFTNWQQVFQVEGVGIDNEPYVAYSTGNSFHIASKVMASNGISFDWKQVGDAIVDGKAVTEMGFTQSNGVPYVAYADPNSRDRLRVQYLTEAGYWDDVDSSRAYLSDGAVSHIDIVSANGVLYVAAIEVTEGDVNKVKVVSFEL